MFEQPLLLIVNPIAGRSQGKTELFSIVNPLHKAGYNVTVYPTQYKLDAAEAVVRLGPDYELVVCCGGDGTLNEVITGLMQLEKRPRLGFVPIGTTNDLAASLGIPKNPVEAVQLIIDGPPMLYDIGRFNHDRFFSYIACFGAFSDIPYLTAQSLKKALGHAAYLLEGMKHIMEIRPRHMRIEWDEGVIEDDFLFGAVTNTTSIGGIIKLKPDFVSLNDGYLDVFLIRNTTNILGLQQMASSILSQNYSNELLYVFKTKNIKFSAEAELPWCLDGEFGGLMSDAEIEIMPGSIQFAAGVTNRLLLD